ncbi:MAG: hypothetical protein ACHQ51_12670 [Elusimicrobiota bacterium]
MRRFSVLGVVLVIAACAPGSSRVSTASSSPSFRAKTVAVASVRGGRNKGVDVARALAARLESDGIHAAALEESDSVLAGSALGMDIASDPRVLAEVRRATGADAIAFLTLAPGWRSLEIVALDLATGEPVLRSTARPKGAAFETADEVAAAAAGALSFMAPRRARAAAAPSGDALDEIPVP